jgi:hypothetical protein
LKANLVIFPKEKKKKESIPIEVMTYENGGSIPTEVRNGLYLCCILS